MRAKIEKVGIGTLVWVLLACSGQNATSAGDAGADVTAVSTAPAAERPSGAVVPKTGGPAAAQTRWLGVAASRWHAGLWAAWSRDQLVVLQHGQIARRVPVDGAAIVGTAVSFDPERRLFLLDRTGTLTVLAPQDEPVRRVLPFAQDTLLLVATQSALVWAGRPPAAFEPMPVRVSRDLGVRWRALRTPEVGNAGYALQVEPDGSLQLMSGFEAACGGGGQQRSTGGLDGRWRDAVWPLDVPYGWFLGPGGWAYARTLAGERCGADAALCAIRGQKIQPVHLPQAPGRPLGEGWPDEGFAADNGGQMVITVGRDLVELEGARMRRLAAAPRGLTALALDAAGRPIAVAHGQLLSWSPASGWQRAIVE